MPCFNKVFAKLKAGSNDQIAVTLDCRNISEGLMTIPFNFKKTFKLDTITANLAASTSKVEVSANAEIGFNFDPTYQLQFRAVKT